MAEGFEAFHVPQHSRRDKLRVLAAHSHHHQEDGFPPPPLYDPPPPPPSIVPSEFLSCAALHHHHQQPLGVVSDHDKTDKVASFDSNFHAPSLYMDPQLHLSQELGRNPFLFAPQNLRFLDADSFPGGGDAGGGEALSVGGSGQGLSLTLSSHHHAHRSSSSSSQLPPLELNLQRYDASMQQQQQTLGGGGGSGGIHGVGDGDLSRGYCSSSVPSPAGGGGPFTGYASILKGSSSSRFLRPAQQLLEEACDVVRGTPIYPQVDDDDDDIVVDDDASRLEPSSAHHDSAAATLHHHLDDSQGGGVNSGGGGELKRKKSRLISMLDEVYRRYRQYYQQLQAVIASFESVAGLNNAAPFANLALKAMSKHFRCLKDAITEQLHFAAKSPQGHMNNFEVVEASPTTDHLGKGFYNFQSATGRNMGLMEHPPVWRPQRGLPERAVTVLRAWLFDHFLHPYPTDTDKLMLAKQTGLSRNQVSNWFINARVRLWKPMVEEIHNLETRQAQKNSQKKEQSNKNQSEHSSMRNNNAVPCEDANASAIMHHHQVQDHHHQQQSSKRTRDEAADERNPMGGRNDGVHEVGAMELSSSSYGGNMSRPGFGPTAAGGVSLTLGLHQNNELGLSGPAESSFPANAAQRFGLDATSSQGFVVSGFDAHSSQFGRGMIG